MRCDLIQLKKSRVGRNDLGKISRFRAGLRELIYKDSNNYRIYEITVKPSTSSQHFIIHLHGTFFKLT